MVTHQIHGDAFAACRRMATYFTFGDHRVLAVHMTPADAFEAGVGHQDDAFFVIHMDDVPAERASFRFVARLPLDTLLTIVNARFPKIPPDIRVTLAHNLFALAACIREGVDDPLQDAIKALSALEREGFPAHEADSYVDTAQRVIEHMRVQAGHADDAADAKAALVQAVGPSRGEQMIKEAREAREARLSPEAACLACARMSKAAGAPVGCPAHEPERYLR